MGYPLGFVLKEIIFKMVSENELSILMAKHTYPVLHGTSHLEWNHPRFPTRKHKSIASRKFGKEEARMSAEEAGMNAFLAYAPPT